METEKVREIKFAVLLLLQIPSIACYIGLIYHMISDKNILRALHHHAPLALLFVGFLAVIVDVSIVLNFLRTGLARPSTDTFCRIWNFIDLLFSTLVSILMLWTSIERHILIFHHHQLLNTKRKRFYIHYMPLIIIFAYLIPYYVYITFLHSCPNNFDYSQMICGGLCFYDFTPVWGVFDQLAHNIIPSILIALLNLGLWFRVLWQKNYRMRRAIEWRQHRKMILQLLPICIIYSFGYLPYGFVQCFRMIHGSTPLSTKIKDLLFYSFYLVCVLHSFASLIVMPEVYRKFFNLHSKRIFPVTIQPNQVTSKINT